MLAISTPVFAGSPDAGNSGGELGPGPTNAVVLIIRHAEKPGSGSGLSAAGEARAKAYVNYFQSFKVDSKQVKVDQLFSAADSRESRRSRLTLEPLGRALGLKLDCRFKNKQFPALAREIQSQPPGKSILICWHHGEIPQLLRTLGADPQKLLPRARWPDDVYGWVIQLRYGANGQLLAGQCIPENLLPEDAGKSATVAP